MKTLEYVPVPAFEDNYIWLVSDGHNAVVVDPGDAAPVEAYLTKRGWRLTAILLTHHHHDHVGGVAKLLVSQSADGEIPVIGPAGEAIEHLTRRVKQGDHVSIASPALECSVIDVPGHTAGHIAYFQPADPEGTPHLFCGDTLFASGCGRLFEGTPQQMHHSLQRLATLPDATLVYCAHEYTLSNLRFAVAVEPDNPDVAARFEQVTQWREQDRISLPSNLALERKTNPFLRASQPSVKQKADERTGTDNASPVEVFAALRAWKDKF